MTVCVVGSAGASTRWPTCWPAPPTSWSTPGNPGMAAADRRVTGRRPPVEEIEADLFVIGPEAPLVDGLADRLRAAGPAVLGPGADGARLEGSKAFMKEVLAEAGVPTAALRRLRRRSRPATAFLAPLPGPWVVKTDGLAAGKGVLVTESLDEAERRRRRPSSRATPSATPGGAW